MHRHRHRAPTSGKVLSLADVETHDAKGTESALHVGGAASTDLLMQKDVKK